MKYHPNHQISNNIVLQSSSTNNQRDKVSGFPIQSWNHLTNDSVVRDIAFMMKWYLAFVHLRKFSKFEKISFPKKKNVNLPGLKSLHHANSECYPHQQCINYLEKISRVHRHVSPKNVKFAQKYLKITSVDTCILANIDVDLFDIFLKGEDQSFCFSVVEDKFWKTWET